MNKWILFAVLTANEEKLRKGLLFTEIDQAIKKRHPRGKDLNSANLRNALVKVDELQWTKNIKPFVIDYDEATRRLYIVDKSFYLWRRHQKQKDLLSYIDLTLDGEKATA